MRYLLVLVSAMTISMVLIPMMVRLAPRLGLIDRPDHRKVHASPIPRVGGWGIIFGALIALLMVLSLSELVLSYILGSLVLFMFGVWDDRHEVGHYHKFVGQFIAVLIVVLYGNLYIESFPFLENHSLPSSIGIPFTVMAMIGVINAINHSDGLDGLAGGESLFSLGVIAFLAYLNGGTIALMVALATIGGVFGFLRYNTHPASVFMGDSGSQFLGFTLGFLAILLTQRIDSNLSPAVVLLLLGLPVADIIAVLLKRIRQNLNWFRATRNHVHHRLLDLGFVHQESVVVIYSLQMFFVTSGALLRYENDWVIFSLYLLVCAAIFGSLSLAEKSGWRARQQFFYRFLADLINRIKTSRVLVVGPRRFLSTAIPLYLIGSSFWVNNIPWDIGLMAALVFWLMVIESFYPTSVRPVIRRALLYTGAALVVYLNYPPVWHLWERSVETIFFGLVALAVAVAIKSSPGRRRVEFKTTATDYLVVFVLFIGMVVTRGQLSENEAIAFVVKMVIIFYGCELLLTEERRERWSRFRLSSLAAVMVLSMRGLI